VSVPLDQQTKRDMIWIMEPFLSSDADHGVVVVHGHTPVGEPQILSNRIAIDTGAVFCSGTLTCAVFEDDKVGFLQA
jgi:serine/threonine protein phosphatase 1